MRVALVSCASKKIAFTTSAETLYSSDLFRKASRVASRRFDRWYILSAKHGLIEPTKEIEPYDETLNRMSREARKSWAEDVFASLRTRVNRGDEVVFFAGARYREHLQNLLGDIGVLTSAPTAGLSIGRQLQWLNVQLIEVERLGHLDRCYELLKKLTQSRHGAFVLGESSAKFHWPEKGVYFFFDPCERRTFDSFTSRIVRVGTHGVSAGSKSNLWGRLRTHRGAVDRTGNHRGSIFRLHVGAALQVSATQRVQSWGIGQSAERQVRQGEVELELAVSDYLGRMAVVPVGVHDESGPTSDRAYLERNLIGLIVGPTGPVDLPSETWLGRQSPSKEIRLSGLWNIDHVFSTYDPRFLDVLEHYVDVARGIAPDSRRSIAPRDWKRSKGKRPEEAHQLSLLLEDSNPDE